MSIVLLLAKQMCLAQRSIQTTILLAKNVGLDRFKKKQKTIRITVFLLHTVQTADFKAVL